MRRLAFLLLLGVLTSQVSLALERPNVVLVLIDDLGAEAVGCYGGESYATPYMDALSERGMRFDNAFSAPMCMISRVTLMSGRYGFRSHLPSNNDHIARRGEGWGPDEITVANLLQDAGYTTAISGKWHLCQHDKHPGHLADKGFKHQNAWAWILGTERTRRYWLPTYFRDQEPIEEKDPEQFGPDAFCQYALDFIAEQKDADGPFFAYYPMVLVHSPWPQTPDNIDDLQPGWTPEDNLRIAENQKWNAQNLSAMIEYTDKLIGRVATAIDDLGIAENTLLIVTADNGTYYRARSKYRGTTMPGGKGRVSDSGIRVPFFAVWPGQIEPGSVNENLVDFTDVLPTLVEVAGGKLPEGVHLDGQSFLGQMLGQADAPARDWVFAGNGKRAMMRAHDYSLGADGALYDLREDRYNPQPIPEENLTPQQSELLGTLQPAMEALGHRYTQGLKRAR